MKRTIRVVSLLSVLVLLTASDALACGDKFLVGSRGTRYQRPKNARTASIVIYASPSSDVSGRVESLLHRQGHQARIVSTLDQLSAALRGTAFDVVLAPKDTVAQIKQLVAEATMATVVVALDAHPNATRLLTAVDQAVVAHDRRIR